MNNAKYVIGKYAYNQGLSLFCQCDYEKLVTAYYNHSEAPQEQIQKLQFDVSLRDLKQCDKQLEKATFDLISNMNDGNTNKKYQNFNLCSFGDYLNKIEMHGQVNIHSFGYSYRNNINDTNNSGSVFGGNFGRFVMADYYEWCPGPSYFESNAKGQMQSLWNLTIYDISRTSSVCCIKQFTRCSSTKHIWFSYTCHWSLTTSKQFEYLLMAKQKITGVFKIICCIQVRICTRIF